MKTRKKLLCGEGVEVRSTEAGFVGSWHAGNVFSSDKGFRIIEYHHILSANSSCERLLESVPVSNFIEGEGVCDDGLGFNYRGLIRPMIRPVIAVNFSQLNYGECVDVYYKDAWWEGVVFDRCVGDMDRIVFFPDMGDVMRVGGNAVRVSQDWDEWSGEWRVRGKWVFLELFDEFEKECCPFLVSVKQIWYHVSVKKGFEEIVKEWTCCKRELWRGVLFKVVMENLKITMQEFLKTMDVLEQEELEESYRFLKAKVSDLYGLMKKSKGFDEISEDGVVSGVDSGRLDTELLSSSVKPVFQHEISCGTPMKLRTVPSYMDDKLSMNESCNSSCKVSEKSKGRVWVSGDIVPEYCADAIEEYSKIYCKASKSRRDLHAAELNLRKHLVFLGWKAEYFKTKVFGDGVTLNLMAVECFEPMKEPRTKSDLVKDVIFSRCSELNRLNFSGFYTVLLERNDELITVATLRIYGDKVAEIPLVATRFLYRRKGMCRILMKELEKVLTEVGVERLVLPSAESALDTWIKYFGFSMMSQSERLKLLDFTFLEFQGSIMCEKVLKTACTESSSPRSIKQHFGVANRNAVLDLQGSISSVSEMLQEELVGQSSINLGGGSCCRTGIEVIPCQGEIGLKNSFEGRNDCKKDVKRGNTEILYYKRRQISKPGGAKVFVLDDWIW